MQSIREQDDEEGRNSEQSSNSEEESVLSIYEEDEDEDENMLSRTMVHASKTLKKPIDIMALLAKKTPEESYTDEDIQHVMELGFDGKELQSIKINLHMAQKNMKGDSEILSRYKMLMDKVADNYTNYQKCVNHYNNLTKSRDDLQRERYHAFMTGFNFISMKLKMVY